ncbi:MAG: two-component response transcriptional regulator [Rhodospirillaceae bacterium]|nr:MAG: two-component response transcriptional regulator [Rhodospirillaceae bacterium]TAN64024.1 MAG: response regulator [Magnetospirillum sp.]TNC97901.1 MAG: putative two component response transcriptional regulator (OmpR family) [Stygiobacter sp.]
MTDQPHILVVDDDQEIGALLKEFLGMQGFMVTTVGDGAAMRKTVEAGRINLVILDLMLPGEDGLSLCRFLRDTTRLPVIMLTAMGGETDRVVGLEMGADDYLAKPFSTRELLARIKAVLRRVNDRGAPEGETVLAAPRDAAHHDIMTFTGWTLDTGRRQLRSPDGVLVEITGGEFDLLMAFLLNPQRVLNRDQLLDLTRGRMAGPLDRTIDVQVGRLRRKLEVDPKNPELIKTVRGGGYVLTTEVRRHERY